MWTIGDIEITQLCDLAQRPYFTADELRAFVASTKTTLSETITDQDIDSILYHVEDLFDIAAGKSFCLRGKRETIFADGTQTYLVENVGISGIVSCTVDGVACDVATIHPVGLGMLYFDAIPTGTIELHYTYGDERETPSLKRNALLYAKSILGTSTLDPRATGAQNADYGFMRFTVAGQDGATGIPEVDAFLSSNPAMGGHGVKRLVFG
ncbi:MAG: hypothetical protein HGA54_01685 [Actinobacteria bacterium]|nr:hypothetical protein [Actinomycetota bacterium]